MRECEISKSPHPHQVRSAIWRDRHGLQLLKSMIRPKNLPGVQRRTLAGHGMDELLSHVVLVPAVYRTAAEMLWNRQSPGT